MVGLVLYTLSCPKAMFMWVFGLKVRFGVKLLGLVLVVLLLLCTNPLSHKGGSTRFDCWGDETWFWFGEGCEDRFWLESVGSCWVVAFTKKLLVKLGLLGVWESSWTRFANCGGIWLYIGEKFCG